MVRGPRQWSRGSITGLVRSGLQEILLKLIFQFINDLKVGLPERMEEGILANAGLGLYTSRSSKERSFIVDVLLGKVGVFNQNH